MSKWSPTGQLVRYLKHLELKGGGHADLAGKVNKMMTADTKFGLLKGLGATPGAKIPSSWIDEIQNTPRNFPMLGEHAGVSEKQAKHLRSLLQEKRYDLGQYGEWAKAGTPDKHEMIDWRNTIDDAWNDRFMSQPGKDLGNPEGVDIYEASDKAHSMLEWMKRRGLFK